jgi:hypothetical protein
MTRKGGGMFADGYNQLAPAQSLQRSLDSALRETGHLRACAFDDFSRPRYDKLWRISVLRPVVSFLFRIPILWRNAHGIWCLVRGQQKLQRHWQLPPLVSAVVLPIKSSRPICTRSSCVRDARNVASAMRPLPNRGRKPLLFISELLQSLGNSHANERQPRPNRSRQRKIDPFVRRGAHRRRPPFRVARRIVLSLNHLHESRRATFL